MRFAGLFVGMVLLMAADVYGSDEYGNSSADMGSAVKQVLIDIPDLGGIRTTGNPALTHTLEAYSNVGVMEYSIWHDGSYSQAEVGTTTVANNITFPHYKTFMITINRHGNIGWLFCRENDNYLGCTYLKSSGTMNSMAEMTSQEKQSLLNVTGLGRVRTTGNQLAIHTLELYANESSTMEYSVWHEGNYSQGEISPGSRKNISFPHYKAFMLTINRHYAIGWLFCKENDNALACLYLKGPGTLGVNAYMMNPSKQTLVDVQDLGGVRTTGDPSATHTLEIYVTGGNGVVEYSLWQGSAYSQDEANIYSMNGSIKNTTFPHYATFMTTINRYANIGWLFCRENDNLLGCAYLKSMTDTSTTTTTTTTSTITSSTTTTSTTTTTTMSCNMPGNGAPCDQVTLAEVVAAINQWSAGGMGLGQIIDLINSWSDPSTYVPN